MTTTQRRSQSEIPSFPISKSVWDDSGRARIRSSAKAPSMRCAPAIGRGGQTLLRGIEPAVEAVGRAGQTYYYDPATGQYYTYDSVTGRFYYRAPVQ
jgi:hypothetical protein